MDDHERRAAAESLFREVNERIAESARRFDAAQTEFVCECSDPACTARVHASLDEYEDVRSDGATFLLRPGHEQPDIERVVTDVGRYRVVEKVQQHVRAFVLRMNPRAA